MAIATETILEARRVHRRRRAPGARQGPTAGPGLVIQEAWGVNAHIEDVMRRFAAAGYLTWRQTCSPSTATARRRSGATGWRS